MRLSSLWSRDNLQFAWRWLRSNPDAAYKAFFRDLYGICAIADIRLLTRHHDLLRRGIYEKAQPCKLFFCKRSSIHRPYSLLTIDNQIVYQANRNLSRNGTFRTVKHRCNTEVVGHL